METSKFNFFINIHRVTRDAFTTDKNIERNPLHYPHLQNFIYSIL